MISVLSSSTAGFTRDSKLRVFKTPHAGFLRVLDRRTFQMRSFCGVYEKKIKILKSKQSVYAKFFAIIRAFLDHYAILFIFSLVLS